MMRVATLAAVLTIVLVPVSCGQDEPPDASAPPLEPAVRAWAAAYWGGDGETAFDLQSARCRGREAKSDFVRIIEQFGRDDVAMTSYAEDIADEVATATYELSDPTLNQAAQRWVLENGAWRQDAC